MNFRLPWDLALGAAIPELQSEKDDAMLTSRLPKYAWTCSWFACAATAVLSYGAAASDALIRSTACPACHQINRKIVGPSFQDIAARQGDKPDAIDVLARSIRNGSTGV